jgi:hypothetical protein
MPPNRRAGLSAYVEKYKSPYRDTPSYVIHCGLCRAEDLDWSSRIAARRVYGGGRTKRRYDSAGRLQRGSTDLFSEAMNFWTVHMGVHHPDAPQPDWRLPDDLDPRIEDVEHRFFEVTPEQKLLRAIFGKPSVDGG